MGSRDLKPGVLAGVLLVALFMTSSEGWAQSFVPYTNPAGGFTIMYPNTWEQRMVGTTLVALSPQESAADTFRENVNVVHETLPAPMAAQQYAMMNMQAMQRQLNSFAVQERGAAMVANQPAYYIVYQHFMNNQVIQVLAYFLVRGNRGYVITCSAAPQDFLRYRPSFVQIANTLRLH